MVLGHFRNRCRACVRSGPWCAARACPYGALVLTQYAVPAACFLAVGTAYSVQTPQTLFMSTSSAPAALPHFTLSPALAPLQAPHLLGALDYRVMASGKVWQTRQPADLQAAPHLDVPVKGQTGIRSAANWLAGSVQATPGPRLPDRTAKRHGPAWALVQRHGGIGTR